MRRRGRRAYIRSVYSLPSLATLGNAVCGFASIWVAAMTPTELTQDPVTNWFAHHNLTLAAYMVFLAMVFDALDGRLARFARHTTDFGGQLDSLADVLSFGAAPAFLALRVVNELDRAGVSNMLSRLIWATGALYMCCAAIRLARFNVSNQHGEQHHFSFLGLPSPGAGGAVAAFVLMQQELRLEGAESLAVACGWLLPVVVLATGLMMVSGVRYPHLINRYLRGRRSIGRVLLVLACLLLLVVAHKYTLAVGTLTFAAWGPTGWAMARLRPRVVAQAHAPDAAGGLPGPHPAP
jgi:CDP-diacylglycerol--serine O-phosphatidyltransferase